MKKTKPFKAKGWPRFFRTTADIYRVMQKGGHPECWYAKKQYWFKSYFSKSMARLISERGAQPISAISAASMIGKAALSK